MIMFGGIYNGKRILLTGHTGFKGSWLSLWLRTLGAEVHGYALPPDTTPNLYSVIGADTFASEELTDIRDGGKILAAVKRINPDFIFHLAAQPLVRESYRQPVETMQTNVMGTINLLEAIRQLGRPVTTLIVTTDKCYENVGWNYGYRETDPLGGHDVYSMSKAACELTVAAWRRSFFIPEKLGPLVTARAGNVIGGGDFAADRIVPDCIRALSAGKSINVRNPHATRPWQHVLDCLSGYLWLAARLHQQDNSSPLASAFNFGPSLQSNQNVRVLVEEILKNWPGQWQDTSDPKAVHEASRLHLSIDKAAALLDWQPTWDFADAIAQTVGWYKQWHDHGTAGLREFTLAQITSFAHAGQNIGNPWAHETNS